MGFPIEPFLDVRILRYRRETTNSLFLVVGNLSAAGALGAIADPALSRCIAPPAQEFLVFGLKIFSSFNNPSVE